MKTRRVSLTVRAMTLRAIVVYPNERTSDLGCLLAIARAEACRREGVKVNPPVRSLVFVAELGVYVAIYQTAEKSNPGQKSMG